MIEMIIQRRRDEQSFDISSLISNISWSTDLGSQPGKLSFTYIEDPQMIPHYGDLIRFRFDRQNVFFGRLFKKSRNDSGEMQITAYDQMRFLKNNETYLFKAMTSSQIFQRICRDAQIPFRIVDPSVIKVSEKIYGNKSLYDMIEDALSQTVVMNRRAHYIIRDNFGTLEHIHVNRLRTGLVIGDSSRLTDFSFNGSVDSDTYNEVQLIRDIPEADRASRRFRDKRQIHTVSDNKTMNTWGRLRLTENVDAKTNIARMRSRAASLLEEKNRPTRTLSLSSLGDVRIRAGNTVALDIARLRNEGFSANQQAFVSKCAHKWSGGTHVMNLTLEV